MLLLSTRNNTFDFVVMIRLDARLQMSDIILSYPTYHYHCNPFRFEPQQYRPKVCKTCFNAQADHEDAAVVLVESAPIAPAAEIVVPVVPAASENDATRVDITRPFHHDNHPQVNAAD